jgi:AcrR family transcriptional regulator
MAVAVQRAKRRQQREETRRQILDAAQSFLREQSFRELSAEAVMQRTGHTRTVFYRHFEDVPALILALIAEVGTELVDLGERWSQTERVSPAEARERLAGFVDFYARNGPLVRAVVEASHHDTTVEEAYSQMVEGFIDLTARSIQARIHSGELTPIDAEETARALIRMLNGYLGDALAREEPIDRERVLDVVSTIWTRTLFPAHGG